MRDTLHLKFDSLQAVIVRPKTLHPKLKDDTIEYNTGDILMRPNAVVEELLGRLPGLQIDANGNITYNGEKIQHLLVDGEDIFGSDPTLITRNFDATKIARVQVLDRKSDQVIFTGIDDGSRTKTLNLVLKESEKNGYFGKVEGGSSTKGFYNANGLLASFHGKEQLAAIGLASNIGIVGINSNAAAITILNTNADALGASAGNGIPQFTAMGLHYADRWDGSNNHVASNYQYSHYQTEPVTSTETVQTQPDSIYTQNQKSQSVNVLNQHWISGIYDLPLKANSAIHLSFRAAQSDGQNKLAVTGVSTFNDTLVNSNLRTIKDISNEKKIGGDLLWNAQVGKTAGRIISVITGISKIDNSTNGYIYSFNRFYQANGSLQSIDTVDQRKQIASHSLNITSNLGFAEPLKKGMMLGFKYGIVYAGDNPLQATFAQKDGKYEDYVDSLSSHFTNTAITQRFGVNLEGKATHLTYSIGNEWIDYLYRQRGQSMDSLFRLHFLNIAPQIRVNFNINSTTQFKLNYSTSTRVPSITQLQPVKNNNDPLHILLGNPELQPSLSQSIKLDFHRFKKSIINIGMNLEFVSNAISTRTTTDSIGRQVSQPINVNGGRTAGLNFSLDRKIGEFDFGFRSIGAYSRSVNYINTELSSNNTYSGNCGFTLRQYVPNKYSFQIYASVSYFDAISTINSSAPIHYWGQNHSGSVSLFLFHDFEINSNATYTWQEKTSIFSANTSILLWNVFIGRNFWNNRVVIKLSGNNLLGQNAAISRGNIGNTNTESTTNILGRYWMLSAAYHFTHKTRNK